MLENEVKSLKTSKQDLQSKLESTTTELLTEVSKSTHLDKLLKERNLSFDNLNVALREKERMELENGRNGKMDEKHRNRTFELEKESLERERNELESKVEKLEKEKKELKSEGLRLENRVRVLELSGVGVGSKSGSGIPTLKSRQLITNGDDDNDGTIQELKKEIEQLKVEKLEIESKLKSSIENDSPISKQQTSRFGFNPSSSTSTSHKPARKPRSSSISIIESRPSPSTLR